MQDQSPCAVVSEISFVDQDKVKPGGDDSESSLGSTEVLDLVEQETVPEDARSGSNQKEWLRRKEKDHHFGDNDAFGNESQSPLDQKDTSDTQAMNERTSFMNNAHESVHIPDETLLGKDISSKDVVSELRTYRHIIAKLTDENDSLKIQTTQQRLTIESLEKQMHEVQSQQHPTNPNELEHLKEELNMKNSMIENAILKNTNMEQDMVDLQVKIASLGETVMQLEHSNEKLEQEKQVLQKLLSTSRELAVNKSLLDRRADKSFDMSLNRSLIDKSVDMDLNLTSDDVDISRDSSSTTQSTLVIESLRKELDATKGRENELRQQLRTLMSKKEGTDGIMDKISESQQEAIEYLTSEIEELRVQLQQEEAKVAGFIEKSVSNQDTIQVLEEENHAVAAQILQREKQLETIKQDLSTKLGENACLRDEIVELEQRLQNMEQLDNGNSQLEHQRKTIRKGSSSPKRNLSLGRDVIKTPERRLRRNDSETELSLMTVEMENGDQGDADLIESFKQNENQNNVSVTKKFDILKKAMKQKYEKKIRKLKETVSAREDEVKELKRTLKSKESELRRSQEDAEDMEIKRVFMEAEMNQETEGLRTVLKDRCLQVEALKKALLRLQRETGNDLSQSNLQTISDLLIDGVGAGFDYIGSFMSSFDAEDNADRS